MQFPAQYNPQNAQDILRYAKWLIGKSFDDVLITNLFGGSIDNIESTPFEFSAEIGEHKRSSLSSILKKNDVYKEKAEKYGNGQRKGGLGNLIEEHFFHYNANSNQEADFSQAGIELKVSPFEERMSKRKNSGKKYYVAGERLVLSMIDFNQRPVIFTLEDSHLWQKCSKILLVYYLRDKTLENNLLYKINFVDIFTPIASDLIIIKQDYKYIMEKIAQGKAHEISEGDTMYLGACTKGSTAEKSMVKQENGIYAKGRAFCYKISYMTMVLNNHFVNAPHKLESVISNIKEPESVISNINKLKSSGFEGFIKSKVEKYINKTDRDICESLGIKYTGGKSQWISIAFAILGIKSNKAEEFLKANIVVKAIRIEDNGNIRENMSFPPFKFKNLVEEEWVDLEEIDEDSDLERNVNNSLNKKPSTLQLYFSSSKFLFVVFKKERGDYVLKGCQLWNMPYNDLNITVRTGWERIRDTVINGVQLTRKVMKNGKKRGEYQISNNFPRKNANPIIHIRPHASKSYYKFDGYECGNPSDGNELPDGRWMTTQCFWLNNTYVKSVLCDNLK